MTDYELPATVFRTGADAYVFFGERLAGGDTAIHVAHLDGGGRLIGVSIHDVCLSDADLPIPAILGEALQQDAAALLIAQNCPDAPVLPSDAAIAVTRRLAAAAHRIGIRLLDRLVFGSDGCGSFRQLGLL